MKNSESDLGAFLSRYYKKIMIFVTVIVILCIVLLIVIPLSHINRPRTMIEINVAPGNASIDIDGKMYSNGIYEITPGTHKISISADEFEPKEFSIETEADKTTRLATYLSNAEGLSVYEKNIGDLNILATMDDAEVIDFMKEYNKKISIKNSLPIDASYAVDGAGINLSQTISDGSEDSRCNMAFCLLISGYGEPNEYVLKNALNNLGYNLDNYEVIYDFKD